jgi:hypothetical protein
MEANDFDTRFKQRSNGFVDVAGCHHAVIRDEQRPAKAKRFGFRAKFCY